MGNEIIKEVEASLLQQLDILINVFLNNIEIIFINF
jgi:hypothetical protein